MGVRTIANDCLNRGLIAFMVTLSSNACDPAQDAPTSTDDGPTFLTVVAAAVQPSSPDEGIAVVVQARGGTQVRVITYGGKHRYAALGGAVESSCAELPGREPLYLLVKPDDRTCVLEARLYADCDPDDGGSARQMCIANSEFVTSVVVPISAALINREPVDIWSARDAAPQRLEAAVLGDATARDATPTDVVSEAPRDAASGDR
jgi:hypothetical protein